MTWARRLSQASSVLPAVVAGLMLALPGFVLPARAASLADNAVIGAEFDANWPRPGSFGVGFSDLIEELPDIGRGGPMPVGPGLHYTLSLSALSGTALLCEAAKASFCAKVPFHKDIRSTGEGPVITSFWRPSRTLKITMEFASTGSVKVVVDYDGPPRTATVPAIAPPQPGNSVAEVLPRPSSPPQPPQSAQFKQFQPTVVPVPAGVWLLGSAIGALAALKRRRARS